MYAGDHMLLSGALALMKGVCDWKDYSHHPAAKSHPLSPWAWQRTVRWPPAASHQQGHQCVAYWCRLSAAASPCRAAHMTIFGWGKKQVGGWMLKKSKYITSMHHIFHKEKTVLRSCPYNLVRGINSTLISLFLTSIYSPRHILS